MTDMEIALVRAGVKVPSRLERVWRWVKDHPNKSSTAASQALNIKASITSGALGSLERRKQVRGVWVNMRVMRKDRLGKASVVMRPIKHYVAIGEKWEVMPECGPLTSRKVGKRAATPFVQEVAKVGEKFVANRVVEEQTPQPTPAPPPSEKLDPVQASGFPAPTSVAVILADLNVRQAYELWQELGKMFH